MALDDGAVRARLAYLTELRRRAGGAGPAREVKLTAGVDFGPHGFVVDGRKTSRSAGVTRPVLTALTAAARVIGDDDKNPFDKLTARDRMAVLDHALPFLIYRRERPGRPSSVDVKARAAGFALLSRLADAMVTKQESKQRAALYDVLLDAAASEKAPGLRRHMLLGLDGVAKKQLSGEQVRLKNALVEGLRPSAPPYATWFGDDEKPVFRVVQSVQDEFWKLELSSYRSHGFEIEELSKKRAVATKVMEDPEGKHPPTTVRVELLQRDEAVLEPMGDKDAHMVFYTGHAQLGGVATTSLDSAPSSEGPKKLLGFFACRTKQNLAGLSRAFPDAHVLVSNNGTYGHDDRIVIQEILKGVARRASYAEMEQAAEKRELWEPGNYMFPGDADTLQHQDRDRDGRADVSGGRRDALFDVGLRKGQGASISFRPLAKVPDPATLDGAKVMDAVQWFNTEWFYFTESFGTRAETAKADRFRADGWFTSDDADEIVRVEEVRERGQEPVYRVKVNAAYAHQDPHAIAMMVTYELAQQLFAEHRPDEGEHERRMKSLALTCSYLVNVQTWSDTGDLLLQQFAKRFDFPPSLTFDLAWTAVSADHKHEASDKVVDKLERGMQYPFLEVNEARTDVAFRKYVEGALRLLKESGTEVGRATFDAIVSGRVRVDTLGDLSKHDFLKVRKELAVEGVDVPVSDFLKLHDEKNKAYRAIRDSIDGYMWDDRVYVAPNLEKEHLARILAHEVNHVLNRSEESYRGKDKIFVEEYRANVAELYAVGEKLTPARAKKLKEEVIEKYGLTGLDPRDFPDQPGGVFVTCGAETEAPA